MSTYLSVNNDLEFLKIKTKDDETKDLKYRTEKHDHEKILKSLKIDNTILYEETLNQSMIDKKDDEKEAIELKKIYIQKPDKRREIMNSTKFKVADLFGDVINKNSISPEQLAKLNNFLAKIM